MHYASHVSLNSDRNYSCMNMSTTDKIALMGETLLILLLAGGIASSAASPPPGTSKPHRPFGRIFAFGDSYTDTGNTVSTTGPSGFNYVSSLPYGVTFFHRPTNRYSDGRLVVDFLAESLSLPFLPPYKKAAPAAAVASGVNFAVAGATAIPHAFFVKNNMSLDITPESIGTQLMWFDKLLQNERCSGRRSGCEGMLDDALFWVGEIGVNDYAYSFTSSVDSRKIQDMALAGVSRFLEALLSRGAKYLVVQGLPPTGCLPLSLTLASEGDRDAMGCVATVNRLILQHNARLQAQLRTLAKNHPDAAIVHADFWDAYAAVLSKPSMYGIKERFRTCCGSGGGPYNYALFDACGSASSSACPNPSQYVNWDGVHLTEGMYRAVSERFLRGPSCRPAFEYLLRKRMSKMGE